MKQQSRANLVMTFGADFADRVENIRLSRWEGPIESLLGVHLLKITDQHPPEVATFENIETYLRQEWVMNQIRTLQQERIDEIRARYRIEFVEE
jgi:hypothetical protein